MAQQPQAGDGEQRSLVPRSRCSPHLMRSVRKGSTTALGQIGSARSISTLLTALEGAGKITLFRHECDRVRNVC
ncbi:hypothetical protein [Chamaesiphon polymorphus]|uniref:hypothetical protein n=1 Tax=Chamaesiphon polymorphus TaxID=2107691 RepID=UPI0011B248AE|nr:hypothetical protein [Chamaesiphon polymorphus]